MLHILITKGRFRRCHEVGLYGVRPSSLNQLAQVREGDVAYVYERLGGVIFGPYRVSGPVRYAGPRLSPPIWEYASPLGSCEKFRYVVALTAPRELQRITVADFYHAARGAGVPLSPADFVKRSVHTFLPADGAATKAALAAAPRQAALGITSAPGRFPTEGFADVRAENLPYLLRHERMDEALLEFLLMREGGDLAADLNARPVCNQLRIDDRGERIDLLYAGAGHIYVVELKTTRRDAEARRDITRYELWARGRRRDLAARLALDAERPLVTPVLVAAGGPSRPADCRIYDWRISDPPGRLAFERVQ